MAMSEEINASGMGGAGGFGGGWGAEWVLALIALFSIFDRRRDGEGREGIANEFLLNNSANQAGFTRLEGRLDAQQLEGQINNLNATTQESFNRLQSQLGNERLEGHLDGIQGEIGRLAFDNAILAKDAEIRALITGKDAELASFKNFCDTNRNIDGVRTEIAAQTGILINHSDRLAFEAQIREKDLIIAKQNTELSEGRIISTILATLQPPRPVPAYPVQSPYAQFIPEVRLAPPVFPGYPG